MQALANMTQLRTSRTALQGDELRRAAEEQSLQRAERRTFAKPARLRANCDGLRRANDELTHLRATYEATLGSSTCA